MCCSWCGQQGKILTEIAYFSKVYKVKIPCKLCKSCLDDYKKEIKDGKK